MSAANCDDAPTTDKDGRPRPLGSGCDMGAYEQYDDGTLAVELSSFTAFATSDSVIIKWRTEAEVGNIGFAIYRSNAEHSKYTKIAFIEGAGNSGMPIDYQFADRNVEQGQTYFYCLEDIDILGERSKSEIIRVVIQPAKPVPKKFQLLQNYPNPFNPETWLPYQLAKYAPVTIRIYNAKGQLVRILRLGNQKAGYYLNKSQAAYWNGKDATDECVSSGVYFYQLQAGEFSAMRRMVIMK